MGRSGVTAAPVNDASSGLIGTDVGLWLWRGGVWERVNDERVTQVAGAGWYATDTRICQWRDGAAHCPPTDAGRALAGVQLLYAPPDSDGVAAVDGSGQLWQFDAQACDGGCFVLGGYGELDTCGSILPARINGVAQIDGEWMVATEGGLFNGWMGGDRALSGGWPLAVRDVGATDQAAWIATSQGVFYTPLESWPNETWVYASGLPVEDLSVVLPLSDGSAWLGTVDAGVIHFELEEE